MSRVTSYENRHELLRVCTELDKKIEWAPLIVTAERRADYEAQEMILSRPRPPRPWERKDKSLKDLGGEVGHTVAIVSIPWDVGSGAVLEDVLHLGGGTMLAAWFAACLVPIAIGGAIFGLLASSRKKRQLKRSQVTELQLLVPEPVAYRTTGAMHIGGEIAAQITRVKPVLEDGVPVTKSVDMGMIVLGVDEDSNEITERFLRLDGELQKLAATSAAAREKALQKAGLAGEDLIGRELALREHVLLGRERRQIHATLPKALTAAGAAK